MLTLRQPLRPLGTLTSYLQPVVYKVRQFVMVTSLWKFLPVLSRRTAFVSGKHPSVFSIRTHNTGIFPRGNPFSEFYHLIRLFRRKLTLSTKSMLYWLIIFQASGPQIPTTRSQISLVSAKEVSTSDVVWLTLSSAGSDCRQVT